MSNVIRAILVINAAKKGWSEAARKKAALTRKAKAKPRSLIKGRLGLIDGKKQDAKERAKAEAKEAKRWSTEGRLSASKKARMKAKSSGKFKDYQNYQNEVVGRMLAARQKGDIHRANRLASLMDKITEKRGQAATKEYEAKQAKKKKK